MFTTINQIKSCNPCNDDWMKFVKNYKPDQEIDFKDILKTGVKNAYWCLRTQDYKTIAPILADVAESVLNIYEEEHPNDKRVRKCIQAIRNYACSKISLSELSKHRSTAVDAADAAAYAAVAADAAAAAAYAAAAAAYAYADAADAAAYADATATAAVAVAGRKKQWEKNEKILLKYI